MIWRNISMRKEFLPFAKPMVSEEAIADVAVGAHDCVTMCDRR